MFDGLLPEIGSFISALKLHVDDTSDTKAKQAFHSAWKLLGDYRIKILCYGTDKEIRLYEELIKAIETGSGADYPNKNNSLVDLVRKNLRSELGIT